MIRTVHVCEALGGGVFTALNCLMSNLDHDAFEQHLVYNPRLADLSADWEAKIHPSIRMYLWRCGRAIDPVADARAILRLYRILQSIRPDVIHAHSSKAGLVRLLAPFFPGIPIIYTPHAFSFLQMHLPAPVRAGLKAVEAALAKFAGEIVGVSESERSAALRLTRRASHINLAIDVDEIRRLAGAAPSAGNRPKIGMCGRMVPQKNYPLFQEVAGRMRDVADFVWIGTTDGRAIPDYVTATGWQSREECLRRMNELDLYIHTSLWEGIPITVLEAMALEKPVVAYSCPGNRDAVVHEKTGLLVESADQFVSAITDLLGSPDRRARLGFAGRRSVSRQFAPSRFIEAWSALYRSRVPAMST